MTTGPDDLTPPIIVFGTLGPMAFQTTTWPSSHRSTAP